VQQINFSADNNSERKTPQNLQHFESYANNKDVDQRIRKDNMSSTVELNTNDNFRFPKDIETAIRKLNNKLHSDYPNLKATVTTDENGLKHIQISSTTEYQGYAPNEPYFDLAEGASHTNGIMRVDDSPEFELADAVMWNIDDMNFDNFSSKYLSEYPYDKELNQFNEDVRESLWENSPYESNPVNSENLETVLGKFVDYAAGEDSEQYVSGQITPAEAALSFIQANPQYAKYAVKIGSAYNRETFVKLVDQSQNDGDQFQRYDIDEVADREAMSSDYANANPNAEHYDEIGAPNPPSAMGRGSNEILGVSSNYIETEQPVKSVAEIIEEETQGETL
jgi:hypothetical protein